MLNLQHEMFCTAYACLGAETFSHATKSAIKAGYSEKTAYSQGSKLLKKPEIQQRIRELFAAHLSRNNVTADSVLLNIAHDRQLARDKGDLAVSLRCSELEGKFLELFSNYRMSIDLEVPALDEEQKIEARAIARIRLREMSCLPAISEEIEP